MMVRELVEQCDVAGSASLGPGDSVLRCGKYCEVNSRVIAKMGAFHKGFICPDGVD